MSTKKGGDLFTLDNSDDDWKVLSYPAEWARYLHGSTCLPIALKTRTPVDWA